MVGEARLTTRDDMANLVDQRLETGVSPVANWAPNQVLGERRKTFVALSQLKALGEQAVIAVAASLARGGPIVRGQLIASHFYEALRYELKQSPMHDTQRAALMAASDQCERIAAASINPREMLDELRKAIAVLRGDGHATVPPPTRERPVLRVIEGGLSKD
jgi:hypothetical protein